MIEELHALTADGMMGRVLWDRSRDRLSFIYEPEWRNASASYPLSLSTPLTAAEHGHKVVDAFLWGLLPDNDGILKRWGERFHVSPRHAFQLLMHVGEECAGAVQLVRPERAEKWLAGKETGTIAWLEEAEITGRMRLLLRDHSTARTSADVGQFSLAGAQPKTGFLYDPEQDRWGVPSGMIPTTHIFKPATGAYDGYAENEHFCIALARELGMPVAPSGIRYFEEVPVIVVERYDRVRKGDRVIRIHQEDMCQSLARMPHLKYQSQGGPSPREIIDVIREYSTNRKEDEMRFVDALIFNWLIGGTDAHAKNYSFLVAPGQVRLAPLYDLSSALPYDSANNRLSRVVTGGTAAGTTGYTYNNLNQLTNYSQDGRSVTLTYDNAGNRATRVVSGGSDAGSDTYSYDFENRLIRLVKGSGGGTGTYVYGYDYRTRRVLRDESGAGGVTTKVVFSGGLSVQEYVNGSTYTAVEYLRGSDYGGGVGGILYTLRGTDASYTHENRRGDVVAKTNSSGVLTYQAAYQAYGTRTQEYGSTQDRQKGNSKDEDPWGAKNEGQREYDLEADVFLTADPAGFVDGPNLYTYVKQNPWTKFDPEGLEGVVVSGQPGDHKNRTHFLANGLDRAKKLAKQFASEKKGEQATWMIYNEGGKGGYTQKDLDEYQAKAAKAGVNVKIVNSAKDIIEYTNNKTGGDTRSKDKITNFSYFGHATPGELDPGFVDHSFWNMATMQSVRPGAFESSAFAKNANINLVGGCRTAVSGALGSFLTPSAIDQFATKVDDKSTIKGSTSRVFYSGGVVSDQDLPSKTEGGKIQEIHGVNNNNLPDSYFTPSFPAPTR